MAPILTKNSPTLSGPEPVSVMLYHLPCGPQSDRNRCPNPAFFVDLAPLGPFHAIQVEHVQAVAVLLREVEKVAGLLVPTGARILCLVQMQSLLSSSSAESYLPRRL